MTDAEQTWVTRLGPPARDELSAEALELLAAGSADGEPRTSTFLATMVRHPRLYRKWAPLSAWLLMRGELDARIRELAILRTGWLCQADFEWGQHTEIALAAGIASTEIRRVITGPDDAAWTPLERAVLRSVDELHTTDIISDSTWSALTDHLNDRQLIELIFIIGHYHLVAWVQKSLGTPLEEGARGLDAHEWSGDGTAGRAVARWLEAGSDREAAPSDGSDSVTRRPAGA